ncbi:MAG: M67 family metallopeptidase [Candidatus Saganbacteria bacterium]|nr:M67 family metallopeptidase [Candidatus Saganbacteria bacterium]
MFKITERQYEIILRQAEGCYPQETGGILGGKDDTVLGVLPIFNKEISAPDVSYGITGEDMARAFAFLRKYDLEYFGIYHTHPKGIPFPSEQDLAHNQKYLFIIGLKDRYNPELQAYRIEKNRIIQEQIKIVNDSGFTVIDIHTGKPQLSENVSHEEMDKLARMINDHIHGIEIIYPKMQPVWDASSFSTMA